MRLVIDGISREFEPLSAFRERFGLPATFGVETFQPKTWDGLGSIDGAADALQGVREVVCAAVPVAVPAADWLHSIPQLAATFEAALRQANTAIGLRDEEIAFAVNGFGDVCSAYGLALFKGRVRGTTPDFEAVYREWLYGSVRLGATEAPYPHQRETWQVRVIHHAYGRVGLQITRPDAVHYVADRALACPAEGYMLGLLRAVAARMQATTV
jgi:hypothetical protein